MKRLLVLLLIFPSVAFAQHQVSADQLPAQSYDAQPALRTIAFGSCNRQSEPQVIWAPILENKPNLWIWLGDNIYGDSEDTSVLAAKYRQQKTSPGYTALRKRSTILGTWDDHDFGVNNGGKEYPRRRESKQLLLDFLDVPKNAPVRAREGIYQSYSFGPVGQRVKVILLDCRYFRDPLLRNAERVYVPNETGDILGEAQWQWLERELRDPTAQLFLLCSGIQILPNEHKHEKWANFPKARGRLLSLLSKIKPSRLVLLSGDRHFAELSKMDLQGLPYPLYEITSSGMTHCWENIKEPNQYRLGLPVGKKNFGILRIDWNQSTPRLRVEVRGEGNVSYLNEELRW